MNSNFLNNFPKECDNAIESGDIIQIEELIDKLKVLEGKKTYQTHLCYCIANLYSAMSRINCEDTKQWRNKHFPVNIVQAINYMRKAFNEYMKNGNNGISYEIQTNLANFVPFIVILKLITFGHLIIIM